jgi:hypothetical protein
MLLALGVAAIFAAEADPASGVIDVLLKGGPFAIVLLLVIMDKITTPSERDLLRKKLDESQARERALYEGIKTDLTPALVANGALIAENTRIFNEKVVPVLDRAARALEK